MSVIDNRKEHHMSPQQDPSGDRHRAEPSRRMIRWQNHLSDRGAIIPDKEDFRSFGKLSTLERLRKDLSGIAPEHCGPLAAVISELKRQKTARAGSKAKGGQRGTPIKLSIARADLRPDWRATLDEMRRRRDGIDTGMIDLDHVDPPAHSQLRGIEYVLRGLSKVCIDNDMPVEISLQSVQCWVKRQCANGQNETSTGMLLRQLSWFLSLRGGKKKLRKKLNKEAARYARIGRLKRKRKHEWLLQNPTDVARVWDLAEDVLGQSRGASPGTVKRYLLALHAAALGLPVAVPLRISDLSRFRIGEEIVRNATGWSLQIRTQKTGDDYERSELWPELTEFLDLLITLEAPGGDLWLGYERRKGTPLFSRDRGATGLTADWISDVWYEHVGTGEHIIRTLWHQVAYDSDVDRTWMALALCGQRSRSTSSEYHDKNQRARAVRAGRRVLMATRQQARSQFP